MLSEFAPDIWTVDRTLRAGIVTLGIRMTVIRLQSGGLLLHSPVEWSEELEQAISILGPVRFIVAPNLYHHLFVGDWMDRFPDAVALAAPGLQEKRSELRFDGTLTNDFTPDWGSDLRHECLGGAPKWNEVLLYHLPSQTLVVTDLFFYLDKATGLLALYGWLSGCRSKPKPTLAAKMLIKNKHAFSESIHRVLDWKPERLVLAHGSCVPREAGAMIAKGLKPWA
jgi:hypothetical protein